MLVVKVELHNANTGEVSVIGRCIIANVGGSDRLGNYTVRLGKDGDEVLESIWDDPQKDGAVMQHRRKEPVWSLAAKALRSVGFG